MGDIYIHTDFFFIKTTGGLKLRKSHIHKVCSKEGKVMNTYSPQGGSREVISKGSRASETD